MRTTQHNGRANAAGQAYEARHNDRDGFAAEHIDATRSANNWTWMRYSDAENFEQCEEWYYRRHFADGLDVKNARYEAQRHPERVRTLNQIRRNPRTCPEEQITQIGRVGDTVDARTLWKAVVAEINWEQRRYPGVRYLDIALHQDEPGAAPHIHARRVWAGHDKDGNEIVGQGKALREMGVSRPHPNKPVDRYNNAKMTYTAECREHFQQICREMGLSIETEPREPGRSGLALAELKAETAAARADEAEERARVATAPAQSPQNPPRTPLFHPDRVTIDRSEYDALRALAGQAEQALQAAKTAARDRRRIQQAKAAAEAAQKAAEAARAEAEHGKNAVYAQARAEALQDARDEAARIINEARSKRFSLDTKLQLIRAQSGLNAYIQLESRHPEIFRQMRQEEEDHVVRHRSQNRGGDAR